MGFVVQRFSALFGQKRAKTLDYEPGALRGEERAKALNYEP